MDSIARSGCKLVLNEVYEGEIDGFIDRGDAFFKLMPDPDSEKELSEHSPLYDNGAKETQAVPDRVGQAALGASNAS